MPMTLTTSPMLAPSCSMPPGSRRAIPAADILREGLGDAQGQRSAPPCCAGEREPCLTASALCRLTSSGRLTSSAATPGNRSGSSAGALPDLPVRGGGLPSRTSALARSPTARAHHRTRSRWMSFSCTPGTSATTSDLVAFVEHIDEGLPGVAHDGPLARRSHVAKALDGRRAARAHPHREAVDAARATRRCELPFLAHCSLALLGEPFGQVEKVPEPLEADPRALRLPWARRALPARLPSSPPPPLAMRGQYAEFGSRARWPGREADLAAGPGGPGAGRI